MNTNEVETTEDLTMYEWRGINSRGEARGGRGTIGRTVKLWTERKFWLGWSSLEVRRVGDPTLVAFIGEHSEGGRTWWAEV